MAETKKTSSLERRLMEAIKERAENRNFGDMNVHIEKLKQMGSLFIQEHDFKKGDIVMWKEGLKNKIRPAYGEPCVILEILEVPTFDAERDSGTPYFNEPLTLVLGMIDEDDDFVVLHYDRRRFQPFKKA